MCVQTSHHVVSFSFKCFLSQNIIKTEIESCLPTAILLPFLNKLKAMNRKPFHQEIAAGDKH